METINLGKVAFAYKGDYNPATTYASKDVVFDGESSYISKSDGNVGNALSDATFWGYLAKGNAALSEQNAEEIDTLRADLNQTISDVEEIEGTLPSKADLIGGTVPSEQLPQNLMRTTGNETIAGVKTFISSPVVPAPTTDLQAATKKYVDDTKSTIDAALLNKADLVGGKIPTSQLPAYVDDVLEYENLAAFPASGEAGKIYVALDTNLTYRWSGSTYVEISKSLALGETSSTTYRGDRGKTAYDHSQTTGNAHGTTASQIPNTPAGTIAATTVQGAINELAGDIVQVETNLNTKIDKTSVKQVKGTSTMDVMSQNAVTNEISQLGQKLIQLKGVGAKSSDVPPMSIGDIYYNYNTRSLREKIGSGETAADYRTIPYITGAIYTIGTELYKWDASKNTIVPLFDNIIHITHFGTSGVALNWGETYYNTDSGLLRRRIGTDYIDIPFAIDKIYIYNNDLYSWDGEQLNNMTFNSVKEFLPIILNIYDSDNITSIISQKNVWYSGGQFSGQLYDISQWRGRTLQITGNANNVTYFAFLTTNEISVGTTPDFCQGFGSRIGVELGGKYVIDIPEDANYLYCGNGDRAVVSTPQKIAILAQDIIKEEEDVTISMEGLETDIIATTRNYILKFLSENENYYLEHSDDLGETWKRIQWPDVDICFVHWFSDGTCLIASHSHCYWTEDFVTLHQSSVYDVDGTAFVPNSYHFYKWGNYNSEYHKINGNEVVFWSDYNGGNGLYYSRIWMTIDNGHTIQAIAKSGTTEDTDNNTINVRHFHQTCFVDKTETLYVTTGDTPDQCMLLRGTISNGEWSWERLVSGSAYKYGQVFVNDLYVFLITDITFTGEDTGIVMCPVQELSNPNAYKYIFRIKDVFPSNQENTYPITGFFEDVNGNRLIFPDGIGYNVLWYAYGDMDFTLKHIQYSQKLSFQCVWGANYNGDCIITGVTGYDVANTRTMSQPRRFLLTEAMRNAGIDSFCRQPMLFD